MTGIEKKYQVAEPDPIKKRALRIIKGTATYDDRFVPDHDELKKLIKALRDMDCVIVFVTGVWDLWHIGHGDYIQKGKEGAAELYPNAEHIIMVVGVDSDAFTKQRKGPKRPMVPEDERCRNFKHIRWVDIITLQYEADQLFMVVDHDVRVISQSTDDLPELEKIQKQCAHIVKLPPQAETSTTARIRQITLDGYDELLLKIEKFLKEVRDELKKK